MEKISLDDRKMRVALFVSRYDHCRQELLWRHSIGEFAIDTPLIVSNPSDLEPLARRYGIPFHCFPVTAETRQETEEQEIALLEHHEIDTVVLSPQFVEWYPARIINIHHSFLPDFVGGSPYRQAYQRGVKIIGATPVIT